MEKFRLLCVLTLLSPATCYAMGDPAVIYFACAAGVLSLVGLIVFVWFAKNRIGTAAFYVLGTALFWYWAWNTHLVAANIVGWLLVAFPILLGGIGIVVAKLRS